MVTQSSTTSYKKVLDNRFSRNKNYLITFATKLQSWEELDGKIS